MSAQVLEYPTFTHTMPQIRYSLNGSGEQAQLIDISFWVRTGGVDWVKTANNFDCILIRAGQGYYGIDELLEEHIDKAEDVGLHIHTYWQIDPRENLYTQANTYLNAPGARGRKKCVAWEVTGGGLSTWSDVKTFCKYLQDGDPGQEVYIYSRIRIMYLDAKLSVDDVSQFNWLIAQYPYMPYTDEQYTRFDVFLNDHPFEYPTDIDRFGLEDWIPYIIAQQFTEKLEAPYYFANLYTEDPDHRVGIKSGDGIVSMGSKADFMAWFTGDVVVEPPIDPPPIPEPESEILYMAEVVNCTKLNIRERPWYPAGDALDMGDLRVGSVIAVLEEVEQHGNIWCRFGGSNLWAARTYAGYTYLKIVD